MAAIYVSLPQLHLPLLHLPEITMHQRLLAGEESQVVTGVVTVAGTAPSDVCRRDTALSIGRYILSIGKRVRLQCVFTTIKK